MGYFCRHFGKSVQNMIAFFDHVDRECLYQISGIFETLKGYISIAETLFFPLE